MKAFKKERLTIKESFQKKIKYLSGGEKGRLNILIKFRQWNKK
jgi:ATPase subunit of ABC transporter with duplicated ATPase domains